jgi:hypothetical protein
MIYVIKGMSHTNNSYKGETPFKLGDTTIAPWESSNRGGYGGVPQFERGFPFI